MKKNRQQIKKAVVKKTASPKNLPLKRKADMALLPAAVLVLLVTFFTYHSMVHNDFVLWDDDKYIQNNALIRSFDLGSFFSQYVMGNYHPLTMMVYAFCYQLFGLDPGGYHGMSLLLHLANVLLVFIAVYQLSRGVFGAFVASLLFGLHPLHVESVAWASELKDLVYVFFFLASWIVYLKYIRNGEGKKFYFLSLLLFLCALLSKAMAVSLPLVLLLTDYLEGRRGIRKLMLEKLPFFLLALIFGVVAVFAQQSLGATESTVFPLLQRIFFAGDAFILYLLKMILPVQLSPYYPYPVQPGMPLPGLYYIGLPLALILAGVVYFLARRQRKILFGLGFFVATIFLVLQLLPVGDTMMADRYTYLPSVGLFFLAGEALQELWARNKKLISVSITAALAVFYIVKTNERIRVWESGLTLWNDVIDRYQTVPAAYYNRGIYFFQQNRNEEAFSDFSRAIALKPAYADAYNNRGSVYLKQGRLEEALQDFTRAITLDSTLAQGYFNRGYIYFQSGRTTEALRDYDRVIGLKPDPAQLSIVHNLRGLFYLKEKKYAEAIADFNRAIELNASFPEALNNRGSAWMGQGNLAAAQNDFSAAIELRNNYPEAWFNRGLAALNAGNRQAACRDMQQAAAMGYAPAAAVVQANCH